MSQQVLEPPIMMSAEKDAKPAMLSSWRSFIPAVLAVGGSFALLLIRINTGGERFISDGALMMLALASYLIAAVFHLTNLYAPFRFAERLGLWAATLGVFFNLSSWLLRWVAAYDREFAIFNAPGATPADMPWVFQIHSVCKSLRPEPGVRFWRGHHDPARDAAKTFSHRSRSFAAARGDHPRFGPFYRQRTDRPAAGARFILAADPCRHRVDELRHCPRLLRGRRALSAQRRPSGPEDGHLDKHLCPRGVCDDQQIQRLFAIDIRNLHRIFIYRHIADVARPACRYSLRRMADLGRRRRA